MNRTQLYELAQTTAKANLDLTSPIAIDALIAKTAVDNKVDDADFADFKTYFNAARQAFAGLKSRPLPSEVKTKQSAAAEAAKQVTAPAAAPAKPAAPAPAK